MKKENLMPIKNDLSEEQVLKERLEAIKKENVEKCIAEVNEILEKYNCECTTTVKCVVGDHVIAPTIVSL